MGWGGARGVHPLPPPLRTRDVLEEDVRSKGLYIANLK